MTRHRLVFYLDAGPAAGTFRGRGYPTGSGRVGYEPFRGPGHVLLVRILAGGGAASCWFYRRGRRVDFDAVGEEFVLGPPGCPCHWYLDISRLGRGAADA